MVDFFQKFGEFFVGVGECDVDVVFGEVGDFVDVVVVEVVEQQEDEGMFGCGQVVDCGVECVELFGVFVLSGWEWLCVGCVIDNGVGGSDVEQVVFFVVFLCEGGVEVDVVDLC